MRIAILGGTGQVGSVITQKVSSAFPDAEILSCSRNGGGLNGFKFNVHSDDWTLLGNLDAIINSIGIIEEKGENTFEKAHFGVVSNIIKHRSLIGNPKIVHVSVLGANVNSPSGYASTKGKADELLMQQENWNIIRPSFVCTPGTAIIGKVMMLKNMAKWLFNVLPCPAHFLTAKFQPVMGEDIADVAIACIKNDIREKVVYATGPEIYTLEDWIQIAGNNKIKVLKIPKILVDLPFRIIIKIFPSIMNIDQYLLLAEDNVHEHSELVNILKRQPESTEDFWEMELRSTET